MRKFPTHPIIYSSLDPELWIPKEGRRRILSFINFPQVRNTTRRVSPRIALIFSTKSASMALQFHESKELYILHWGLQLFNFHSFNELQFYGFFPLTFTCLACSQALSCLACVFINILLFLILLLLKQPRSKNMDWRLICLTNDSISQFLLVQSVNYYF